MEGGVTDLVRYFEESEDATRPARELAERDRDYYDGKQLTSDEESALKKRGQPSVIYNRIQRKIDYLSGLEKQQRKDPKAFPRTPDDEDAADAATDAIRYVCDDSGWDVKRSAAWDDLLIPGTCAILVGHKDGKQGPDPDLYCISWDRFFYDPHSSKPDFSDARYMGIVTWYDAEEAKGKWQDKADLFDQALADEAMADTYDDKPKHGLWADAKRKRVRVIEGYYKKRGQWHRCVATKAGELEPAQPSPYLDEDGKPENPIKAMSLYVDRDNNRYGAVRVMISPQDEINKRRSKGLHLITMRQIRVSPAASVTADGKSDPGAIRNEMAKPDGVIVGEKDDVEILPTADMARGNFEMLMEAKAEIDLLGANAALAGKNENDMSGRAILAQQQGGMVEVARMFDRLRSLSIEVYRSIWNRIRQFWGDERWIRVTDDERNLRFVGLNQKITVAMLAQEVAQGDERAIQKASELVGAPLLQAAMQGDERAQMALALFVQQNGQQVVETRNAVNELDVDIVIDEGMDTPTIQAEQFETLTKMLPGMFPQGMPPQALELLVEASSLRNKDKLLDLLQQGPSPEQQAQEQKQAQIAEAGAIAQVEEVQSKALLNQAKAQQAATPAEPQSVDPIDAARLQLEGTQTEIDGYRAETERMEALKPEPPRKEAA
jgi:hypothetical protein